MSIAAFTGGRLVGAFWKCRKVNPAAAQLCQRGSCLVASCLLTWAHHTRVPLPRGFPGEGQWAPQVQPRAEWGDVACSDFCHP